jgi:hypothetical protein
MISILRRSAPGIALLSVAMLAVLLTPANAFGFARPTYVVVDKLNIALAPSGGNDSFAVQGSFNMPVATLESTDVTLTLASNYSIPIPAAAWKRVGKSNTFVGGAFGVTGSMTFWKKGSSKCDFKFTGSKQSLAAYLPSSAPANVSVELEIGPLFDQTLTAVLNISKDGRHYSLNTLGPDRFYVLRKVTVTRNLKKTHKDKALYVSNLYSATPYDPATDPLAITVGPVTLSIPAGTITPPAKGNTLKYQTAFLGGGKATLTINNTESARFTLMLTDVDLSSMDQNAEISLDLRKPADFPLGPVWIDDVTLTTNRSGSLMTY